MQPQYQPPVFLVGCPRSGTTFLQSLLSTHPQIASFRESKFFQYLHPSVYERKRYFFKLVSKQLSPRLEIYFRDELQRPDLLNRLPKVATMKHYTQKFIRILQDLAAEQEKSILLEKTPQHLHAIDDIERFIPQVKIIHLIRNGSDVVASLYEVTHKHPKPWGGKPWDLDFCLERWKNDLAISLSHSNDPNHLLVRYETLVENPQLTLTRICSFIGVQFDEIMLNKFQISAQEMSLPHEGRSVSFKVENANSKKFYEIFNPEQQQYILEQLSEINLDTIPSI